MRLHGVRALLTLTIATTIASMAPTAGAQIDGDTFAPAYQRPPPAQPAAKPDSIEPPAAPFGEAGEFVFSSTFDLGGAYTTYGGSQARGGFIAIEPSVDVFVVRNFSIGAAFTGVYSDGQGYASDGSLRHDHFTSAGGDLRIGLHAPLSPHISLFPRLKFGFTGSSDQLQVVSTGPAAIAPGASESTTRTAPWVLLDLPLLWHVAPRAFVGIVPYVGQELGTTYSGPAPNGVETWGGAELVLGGWVGGADPPARADETLPVKPAAPFGARGQLALSGNLVASGSAYSLAGASSSGGFFALEPGFDYFVVDHVSLGFVVGGSYSKSSAVDPLTGASASSEGGGWYVGPRVGVDLPLGSVVSFWPRATIEAGSSVQDLKEGSYEDDASYVEAWVSVYAPLLVHIEPHLFIGFGPWFALDMVRTVTFSDGATLQDPSTRFGASVVVGLTL